MVRATRRVGVGAVLVTLVLNVCVLTGPLRPAAAAAVVGVSDTAGTYVPVTPYRLLDTRRTPGATPVAPGGSVVVSTASRGELPASGIGAVAVTLTETGGTSAGYLTAYAYGGSTPGTSNVNWMAARATVANGAVVPVSADGRFTLRNTSPGTAHVVVDVTGYYRAGKPTVAGAYAPITPTRVLDTRRGIGLPGTTPLANLETVRVPVATRGQAAAGAGAVVLNLTVTGATAGGYVTVGGPAALPYGGSALNWRSGQTVANLVLAPVDPDGCVALVVTSPGGTAHLVADLVGLTTSGPLAQVGTTAAQRPYRLADTRTNGGAPLAGLGTLVVDPALAPQSMRPGQVSAVVVDVVVTAPASAGYLTAWATGTANPGTSALNWAAGQTVAAAVVVPVGADGTISLGNGSGGTTHVVVDLEGIVLAAPVVEATAWSSEQVTGSDGGTGAAAAVVGVACANGPGCALVSSAAHVDGQRSTSVSRWDGTSWDPPEPLSAWEPTSGAVACADSGLCVASVEQGTSSEVASSQPGGGWTIEVPPVDAQGRTAVVTDLSCPPDGATCVAVGSAHAPDSSASVPYAAIWSGGSWSALPVSFTGDDAVLRSVTCPTDSACTAVGAVHTGSTTSALAASWDGSTWSTEAFVVDGASGSATATQVAARGADVVATGVVGTGGFVADRTGVTWTATAVDSPGPDTFLGAGLACDGQGGCWASTSLGLATVPDATSVAVDAAGGAGASPLTSLSCATSWCVGTAAMDLTAVADRGVVLDEVGGS
ncbi:MAG: hypothetical protein M3Y71_13070, partial [Actinomycetota bacterium]|nr:hypothetical protein [Actinomycetota bacterium]